MCVVAVSLIVSGKRGWIRAGVVTINATESSRRDKYFMYRQQMGGTHTQPLALLPLLSRVNLRPSWAILPVEAIPDSLSAIPILAAENTGQC